MLNHRGEVAMSHDALLSELCGVMADKLGVAPQLVQENTSFASDFGADSLDMVAPMMELEERYDILISEQDVGDFVTLGDAARFVQTRLSASQSCTGS
jgi:acyl carrier protein